MGGTIQSCGIPRFCSDVSNSKSEIQTNSSLNPTTNAYENHEWDLTEIEQDDVNYDADEFNGQIHNMLSQLDQATPKFRNHSQVNGSKYILNTKQQILLEQSQTVFPQPRLCRSIPVEYVPVTQLCETMFVSSPTYSVKTDSLWNCNYITSGILALLSRPTLLARIFGATHTSLVQLHEPDGKVTDAFPIYFLFCGQITQITISHLLPVQPNDEYTSIYISAIANQKRIAFAPIIIKALATLYGSYKSIENGSFGQLVRDLTCAPFEFIRLSDPKAAKTYIQANLNSDYIVSLSNELENAPAHIIKDIEGSKITIQKETGQEQTISMNEIMKTYSFCGVNKCNEDYYYTSLDHKLSDLFTTRKKERFLVQLKSTHPKNHSFISITQQDKRSASVIMGSPQQVTYNLVKVIFVRGFVKGSPKYEVVSQEILTSHCQVGRDITLECTLEASEYLIFVEILYDAAVICSQKVNVNSYSQHPIYLYPCKLPKQRKEVLLESIVTPFLLNPQAQFHRYDEDDRITRMKMYVAGFILIIYSNLSEDGSCLKEMIVVRQKSTQRIVSSQEIIVPASTTAKTWCHDFKKGEDESDFIVDIVFTDFTLTKAKLIKNTTNQAERDPQHRQQRLFDGRLISVYFSVYAYQGGYALYYENLSDNQFTEKLEYIISNLAGEEFDQSKTHSPTISIKNKNKNQYTNTLESTIPPKSSKLFSLRRIDPFFLVSCKFTPTNK